MEKKSSNEILSCLFGGRQKVQFRQKNWAIKFRQKVQICLVSSVANLVGTPLEFAAFRSSLDAKYSRASAFWFFSVHNHGFYSGPNTFCPEKHQHYHVDRQLVTKKEISIKININR